MSQSPKRKPIEPGLLLIGGVWRAAKSGETMPTFDPTTEERITDVAKAGPDDTALAIAAARRAFDVGPWPRLHHEARARILFRIADLLEARAEEFALRESMDMGIPYSDMLHVIVPHCAGLFRFFGGLAMQGMDGAYRRSYEEKLRIITLREPLGVVAAITPFNFPLTLTCSKLAPALAAGNTIVHKPASDTPLTALALAQVLLDAGLPGGVYNLVTGPGGSVGDTLVASPDVDKIAFTGSTQVGQSIMAKGAATMKHLTMELGGKAPNIVFADADLDKALQTAFWAIFWNKGEVCVAGSRILVERPIYNRFVDGLAAMAAEAVIGDPLDPNTQIGPMSSRGQFEKVLRYIDIGKSEARLVAGGTAASIKGKGLFIRPAVFADVTNQMTIAREEIFGPVVPVIPFDDEDDAIRIANDTPYGLASGIQTGDMRRGLLLAERLKAGMVWLNTWHKYHPNGPFGGYKMSGFGREQGVEALEAYTQYKTVWAELG